MCAGHDTHYPSWLNNSSAPADCGYAGIGLVCEGNSTLILPVSDVLLGGGNCPAVRHQISFDKTWMHNTSSNDSLTFFFGCDPRDPVAPDFYTFKIKCTGFKSPPDAGPGDSFVLMPGELERYLVHELATNCSKVVTVPLRGDVLMAESNQINFTSGGYGNVLKRGFELDWSRITEDGCQQCEESYGQCAYSQHRVFLGCLCRGGKAGNP
ncbi:unnamed protein product [Miscanthus lutarioriparius]|uniref:Wall-associated receptor kinase C-terminal domain-containing protein n=1 Tax=Miscanthus lutarioriparius TaxID=422564 RepID=A0A811PAR9_9POAL|nr:unnamed protein product [Miscanthus lutarioriparius]